MANSLRFLKDLFYSLKRDYGKTIDIYHKVEEINIATGVKTVTRTKIKIKRAVLLSINDLILTQFKELISKRDVGGYLESDDQYLIIDRKDIPSTFRLDEGDYVILKEQERYEIKSIVRYDEFGITAIMRSIEGSNLNQILEPKIADKLVVVDKVLWTF